MILTLITKNSDKFRIAQKALEPFQITIKQEAIETPEIQAKTLQEVSEQSALYAVKMLGKAIVKIDSGYCIEALNDFPGPFTKYINEMLTPLDILQMMSGKKQRKMKVIDSLTYCDINLIPHTFFSKIEGIVTPKLSKSDNGTTMNKIFIPEGFSTVQAEIPYPQMLAYWHKNLNHWQQLAHFLNIQKRHLIHER